MKKYNEEVLISILVPVYNVEKYLDRCLSSIVNQTYKNLEIILVVQPSNDNTEAVALRWLSKDDRIRIVYQETPSLSMARNVLKEEAKGDYCCYVDSDDLINVRHVELLYKTALETDADIIQCRIYAFKDDRYIPDFDYSECVTNVYTYRDFTYKMLSGTSVQGAGVVQGKLQKTKLFENIEFPVGRNSEDMATVYKYVWKSRIVAVFNGQTYYYQSERTDSIMHEKTNRLQNKLNGVVCFYEQMCFFHDNDMELESVCCYNLCNQITRSRLYKNPDEIIRVNNKQAYSIVENHKEFLFFVLKSSLSIMKKIICLLGFYSPKIWELLWTINHNRKYRKEWRNKR